MPVKIIYKDKKITVCEKAPGMLTQSDIGGEPGLTELLCSQLGVEQVYPVHRLDRPVGGLIVFALDSRTCAMLSRQAKPGEDKLSRPLSKAYLAVVSGRPDPECGEMSDLMYRNPAINKSFIVSGERKGVKRARLEYSLVKTIYLPEGSFTGGFQGSAESGRQLSLVSITLDTGRTHQIRTQFSYRGMPIAGDGKYGSRIKTENIALWSHRLVISHPSTGEKMTFVSKPPASGIWSYFSDETAENIRY